jgi:translocator protein
MLNKRLAAVFAIAAMSTAQLTGATFRPDRDPETDRWYRSLDKSRLTPPGVVFGIVWTVIDSLLAFSGYRLLTAPPSRSRSAALGCLAVSVLGVAHPWTMFGRRRLDEATAVTAGMVASSVGLVATAADVDRRAIWAAVPLVGWVAFAMYLQEEIWRRNRR